MNRILILSASSGAGHIRAAQALEKAYLNQPGKFQVRHEDALLYTNAAFRNFYSKAYIEMVNSMPGLLGLIYDFADEPWKDERRRLAIDRLNTRPLVKLLKQEKPDQVICTHFLPAEIISYLLCKKQINTNLSIVVTDMDVHAMWLCRHYSKYFVALEETREHMKMLGFDKERIEVSGIPVDPVFAQNKDKFEMRKKYGLHLEKPTIYLSSGGFGVGKTEELICSLAHLKHEVQVLAMCGRNKKLKEKLEGLKHNLSYSSKLDIVPVPHTTAVDEYMSASDIVLGKPGGLTTSEALCKELAFVIVNPIPGQEERNADHLLEKGAAIRCNNLPTLAFKVDELLSDQERFNQIKENVRALSKPNAASNIVKSLSLGNKQSIANSGEGHDCDGRLRKLLDKTRLSAPGNATRSLGNANSDNATRGDKFLRAV